MEESPSKGTGRKRHKHCPVGNATKLRKIVWYKPHDPFYLVRVHKQTSGSVRIGEGLMVGISGKHHA